MSHCISICGLVVTIKGLISNDMDINVLIDKNFSLDCLLCIVKVLVYVKVGIMVVNVSQVDLKKIKILWLVSVIFKSFVEKEDYDFIRSIIIEQDKKIIGTFRIYLIKIINNRHNKRFIDYFVFIFSGILNFGFYFIHGSVFIYYFFF